MPVGLLTLELHIPDAQSLKDKRQVLRSLKDKPAADFMWQWRSWSITTRAESVAGSVTISNEEKHLRKCCKRFWTRRTASSAHF